MCNVHGELSICEAFTDELNHLGYNAIAPNFEAVFDLMDNQVLDKGIVPQENHTQIAKGSKYSAPFGRLMEAGKRLLQVIQKNEGGANKELAKFADQINSLSEKWNR